MMKMVDLAMSQDERDTSHPMMLGMGKSDEPCYSCASFTLDDAALEKLELDGNGAERGDTIHLSVLAKITGVTDMEYGKCFYLQMTHVGVNGEEQSESSDVKSDESRAKGRYSSDEEESD